MRFEIGPSNFGKTKYPYCKEDTEFFYANEWAEEQICDKCKKEFKMRLDFVAVKFRRKKK